jgi:hypothetical protein
LAPDLNQTEADSEDRSLINPFRPEEFAIRITANRRRWIHVFPVDKLGRAKLAHHYVIGKYLDQNPENFTLLEITKTLMLLFLDFKRHS